MAIPSIGDNINETLQEFSLKSFDTVTEVEEYVGDFFKVEDLVGSLKGTVDFFKGFEDSIFKVLDDVLKTFNITDMFGESTGAFKDTLNSSGGGSGVRGSLAASIMDSVTGGTSLGHISEKDALNSVANKICNGSTLNPIRDEYNSAGIVLRRFTLVAVFTAMTCADGTSGFSEMLDTSYGDAKEDVEVPEPVYVDEEGFISQRRTVDIFNKDAIDEAIAINNDRAVIRGDVDSFFSTLVGPILTVSAVTGNTSVIDDITKGDIPVLARGMDSKLVNKALSFLDNTADFGRQPTENINGLRTGLLSLNGEEENFLDVSLTTGYENLKENVRRSYLSRVPDMDNLLAEPNGDLLRNSIDMF